jgi:asparagine synthase (glutamine-hydrolysing)
LFLIRDRIGVKPLYFSTQGGILSFASEIKAILVLPWIKSELNLKAFYDYLTFMVSPAPNTIFDQISKLPAGCYVRVDYKKNISLHEWYSPLKTLSDAEKKELTDENFCLEKIESLLVDSIKKRMITDVPIGAFLSGGLDSSLIVALMSQVSGKVKTFTVAFGDDEQNNELKWARLVAEKFDTQHHELVITEKEAFAFYKDMVYHLDEPLADCVCIPFYYVSKLAKDCGVTVAQVGEGADELFFGYQTYASYKKFYDIYWRSTQKIFPDFIKKGFYKTAKTFLPARVNHLEILKNWAYNKDLFWGGALAFNEHQKEMILSSAVVNKRYDSFDIVNFHLSNLKKVDPQADFVKQMTYLELKNRLPELLLMRADKMSMAASVEGRVPFLDYHLVEFMLNVPTQLKFKNSQPKYLLKKVAEKFLPKEIIYRKKIGFAAPTHRWFDRGEYFKKYFDGIVASQAHKSNFFVSDIKNLENLYKNHGSGFAVQKWVLQNFLTHQSLFGL